MAGKLFIVGTPIGNLEDITIRASRILEKVSFVACEDTRISNRLLEHLGSHAQTKTIHAHSDIRGFTEILGILREEYDVCYLTDAGTPGVSDPGNELISFILENAPDVEVIPIPGVSAVTTILSIAGVNTQKFSFLGFFPKTHHSRFIKELVAYSHPVVFFESTYRILKTIAELEKRLPKDIQVVIGRELTKVHETIYRGTLSEVLEKLKLEKVMRGEFTVLLQLK